MDAAILTRVDLARDVLPRTMLRMEECQRNDEKGQMGGVDGSNTIERDQIDSRAGPRRGGRGNYGDPQPKDRRSFTNQTSLLLTLLTVASSFLLPRAMVSR